MLDIEQHALSTRNPALEHEAQLESMVMGALRQQASIRGFVTKSWQKSDLYSATKITLNAFALSLDDLADLHHRCGGAREVDRHVTRLREQALLSGDSLHPNNTLCVNASNILALVLEDDQLARSGVEVGDDTRRRIADECQQIHPFASLLLKIRTLSLNQAKNTRRSEPLSKHSDPLLGMLTEVCEQAHVALASTVILQLYLDIADATASSSRASYGESVGHNQKGVDVTCQI